MGCVDQMNGRQWVMLGRKGWMVGTSGRYWSFGWGSAVLAEGKFLDC